MKCDRQGAANPHDHGIFVIIYRNDLDALLPGDCLYDTIGDDDSDSELLHNYGDGYTYLVATHHGGTYTHTSSRSKSDYIPVPRSDTDKCVFSAGNGYGHPNPAYVGDYQTAGWNTVETKDLLNTGGNFYYVNW